MSLDEHYKNLKEKTEKIFRNTPQVFCPYFNEYITLNSDGFHHLQFSSRRERNKEEQSLKFSLLPLALIVLKKSGTIQEYRKILQLSGSKSNRDGLTLMKQVQYWGFVAIIGDNPIKIRVIVRRVGDGKKVFWSVMPALKLSNGKDNINRHLSSKGIENN
ncbi:MAG: hypothetical protein A2390_00955 [Candidatus Liptonbacteria bacterium RIFOXYB1_FULL_36_10]|uniref:Uncharacterized protein n=1 Tax=Candidatus Liptonbacteria bacterium RIFOXYB1_FULL_36_10 TaxID=1798654 RepID=A0A1G2CRG0_9BACT|nr:MAG: hypothetical protein A2390_00955 [Candidatus Liptonbacteria bacterium RIFOXYB1_FULL_36_10]